MNKIIEAFDKLMNGITMYRLLIYGLIVLIVGATVFSSLKEVFFTPYALIDSTVVLIIVCYLANKLFSIIYDADANSESWLITALILVCILPPESNIHNLSLLALGGLLANAGKYIVAYKHRHLFNPAALAAVILGVSKILPAIWWIGNPHMLVLTLIFGLMILRKLHRFQLFFVFLVASLILTSIIGVGHHISLSTSLETAFKSSPLIFLGTVMLTEPTTIPPGKRQQGVYGAIVGLIFTCQLSLGPVSATPELALVLGNLYTFAVSPKYKLKLKYKSFTKLAPHIYDISFASDTKIMFKPGQYMDWTLAHKSDSRGNRRTFSIASAPGDSNLHIVMRFQDKASSFKNKLIELTDGDSITVGQLSGNFVMPDDKSKKLLFVAGGIGVTPFISMVSYLVKNDQKRDIVMFYMVSNEAEFCFKDLWQQAAGLGIKVVPVLTNGEPSQLWNGLNGRLSESMLTQYVPAYKERRCYISGPNGFVTSYKSLLKKLGIKQQSIVSDYFSGY